MEPVVLGLGSNRGNSKAILEGAVCKLASLLADIRVSSLYITKPQDYLDQDDFLNMAVSGHYADSPLSLLKAVQRIEADYGRARSCEIFKGPRTLDIDILFWGTKSVKIHSPSLIIPHPALYRRAFALIPLLELFPDSIDPVTRKPLVAILASLPDQGVKKSSFYLKM